MFAAAPIRSGCSPDQRPLFFRGQLEHIADEQVGMIAMVRVEARWHRSGEYPAIIVLPEQPGGHGSTRSDKLWIRDPALGPGWPQPFLGQQKVWRRGVLVVARVSP